MKWFGENWGAPICETTPHVELPAVACHLCKQEFDALDRGVTMPFVGGPVEDVPSFFDEDDNIESVACHISCFMMSILPGEPPLDMVTLEKELEELERTDPAVRKAKEELDRTFGEIIK